MEGCQIETKLSITALEPQNPPVCMGFMHSHPQGGSLLSN